MKKRKLTPLPELYKDVWTLISMYCEWPEQSALRMVCKIMNRAISLDSIHDNLCVWLHICPFYMYTFNMNELSYMVRKYVHKVNTKIKYQRKNKLYTLGIILKPTVARFARSHNYIKHVRPKNWDTFFK